MRRNLYNFPCILNTLLYVYIVTEDKRTVYVHTYPSYREAALINFGSDALPGLMLDLGILKISSGGIFSYFYPCGGL